MAQEYIRLHPDKMIDLDALTNPNRTDTYLDWLLYKLIALISDKNQPRNLRSDIIKKWRFEKPCLKSPSTTQNEPSGHVLELQPSSTLTSTVYTKV